VRHTYTLKISPPDKRDHLYLSKKRVLAPASLPPSCLEIVPKFPAPLDQGQIGSCSANAGIEIRMYYVGPNSALLSRAAQYAWERDRDGTPLSQDAGSTIRTACQVLCDIGACPEADDPYGPATLSVEPSAQAKADAAVLKAKGYQLITSVMLAKLALVEGNPIDIGMKVYESMESPAVAKSGILPLPRRGEQLLGLHSVAIIGYDDNQVIGTNTGAFLVRNSWGAGWGNVQEYAGSFWMSYAAWGKGFGLPLVQEMRTISV
jgi:C1A family cysteine protease